MSRWGFNRRKIKTLQGAGYIRRYGKPVISIQWRNDSYGFNIGPRKRASEVRNHLETALAQWEPVPHFSWWYPCFCSELVRDRCFAPFSPLLLRHCINLETASVQAQYSNRTPIVFRKNVKWVSKVTFKSLSKLYEDSYAHIMSLRNLEKENCPVACARTARNGRGNTTECTICRLNFNLILLWRKSS